MKTLALFTPYELIAGGGTRYILGIAEAFRNTYQVYLVTPMAMPVAAIAAVGPELGIWADHIIPTSWEDAHTRALGRPFNYAVAFGNEPLPQVPGIADRNFFVCQFPFPMQLNDLAIRLIYLSHCESIVVYSEYAKAHLSARLAELSAPAKPIQIIHPAADLISPEREVNQREPKSILSVGRFFDVGSKCQDALIEAFRELDGQGWSLHLAGAIYQGETRYAMYDKCLRLAEGLSVKFYPNASRAEIGRLYSECLCYWHGAGIGADPLTEPEKFEHFGITVVEAMAAGCLPLVLAQGGPSEIVTSGHDGWTFETTAELTERTLHLASLPESRLEEMRARGQERARAFSTDVFQAKWRALLS
ncbi:MAG TPA: glycosyltransferase family 4 protein [Chthoniobacterales bacterium]|nr:glycosyltransferase family 4 protein [Chthoniobacterales bacterium]